MKQFSSVEQAYQDIARYVLSFIDGRQWEKANCTFKVFDKMATANQSFFHNGIEEKKGGFSKDNGAIWDGLDAAIYLRDDMLKTTGNRIWAMTILLYPNNEIKITYDYNKPKDYVEPSENDEPINVFESIERLNAAGAHFGGVTETRPKDKDEK
jgi:hypothetical protein